MLNRFFPAISVEEQDRSYTQPALVAILVLAAVFRLAFLVEIQANPMPVMVSQSPLFDQYNYITMAQDIISHHWLGSSHPGHSPVYSYLIAVLFSFFGRDMNVVFAFQILYGILAVYLFYRCAVLLFQNKNLGLLTAFIAALYSPFIYYECTLLRESVIGYTNLTAFYFFLLALRKEKSKNYFFGGMALGLSLILRAGILPVFVLSYIVVGVKNFQFRFKPFLFVLAGMAVMIAPLTLRNYVSGFKALTETSGPTLFWLGNTYDSPGIGLTYTPTQKLLTAETQGHIGPTLQVLWREMQKHPLEYRDLFGRKFKMLFNGYEIPANLSYDLFKEESLILKLAIFDFVFISPLALLGLLLLFGKYKHSGMFYAFLFALTVFVFIFHIQSRYRVAFMPFNVLAASYTVFWFGEMIKRKAHDSLVVGTIVFLQFFSFTFPDRDIKERFFGGGIRAIDYSNMAGAYVLQIENKNLTGDARVKNLEKAIVYYDKALQRMQGEGRVSIYITQAMVYRDLHLKAHAADALNKALEIDPDNAIARKEYQSMMGFMFIKTKE